MGCVIYYVLTKQHPFGEFQRESILKREEPNLELSRECQYKVQGRQKTYSYFSLLLIHRSCGSEATWKNAKSWSINEVKYNVISFFYTHFPPLHYYRPTASEVRSHCLFWSEEKQIRFFTAVYDHGSQNPDLYRRIKEKNFYKADWINEDWTSLCSIPKTKGG